MRIAVAAFLGLAAACGNASPTLSPTRIVLITIDTLRADALVQMPETLAFAERGVRFEEAFAATATTQPTHASLFTGRHPWQHGVTRNGQVLEESLPTVAERLRERGFETVGIAASFPMERRFGFARGFDRYHDTFRERYVREWEGETLEEGGFYSLADEITARALDELKRAEGDLQFFWFHFFDPHDPYGDRSEERSARIGIGELLAAAAGKDPRASDLVARAKGLYERDVQALDRSLAPLFAALEQDAERMPTHVFFTADHGESFGEMGCLGHGKRLVREQIEVPLFYVGPASPGGGGGTRNDSCGSVDVAATLLAIAGNPGATSGRDLFASSDKPPVAFGMRRTFVGNKFELMLDGRRMAIEGERFFFAGDGRLLSGNADHLFLEDDPTRVVSGGTNLEIRELFRTFQTCLEGVETEELTGDEVREALRALGYTD